MIFNNNISIIYSDLLNALHLAVGDWMTKGAAQRGRTEGAVLPARRPAPEHDPCMTSEHSTTAWWNRPGVDFEERGKPEYPEKNPRSRIEIDWNSAHIRPEPELNLEHRRGRRGWWLLNHPELPRLDKSPKICDHTRNTSFSAMSRPHPHNLEGSVWIRTKQRQTVPNCQPRKFNETVFLLWH